MFKNIDSTLILILTVILGYIWVVITVRPLQNFIAYKLGDRSQKNEGKLSPNPFIHGSIVELLFLSIIYFTKFKFPFFHWDRKNKENFVLHGWQDKLFKYRELISYLLMWLVNIGIFVSIQYVLPYKSAKICCSFLQVAISLLYLLFVIEIALICSLKFLKNFLPQYEHNMIARIITFIIFANIVFRVLGTLLKG